MFRNTSVMAVPVAAALLSGCLAVPSHMRVENVNHPKYEDKDVRFRATYYFRVFDYCADDATGQTVRQPRIDTLYRFRMTGKAHSLTTAVHFESGTLTASQIDPFGSNVAYDERNRQFYFKSQGQAQQEGLRERRFDDLGRLLTTYGQLQAALAGAPARAASAPQAAAPGASAPDPGPAGTEAPAGAGGLLGTFESVIEQRILSLKDPEAPELDKAASPNARGPGASPGAAAGSGAQGESSEPARAGPRIRASEIRECRQTRRGFQILGPEGWRTFNQDERLLLAMSTSGRPLITTMQEISGRVLNQQPVEAELLLPLVREDLRISRAERELDKFTGAHPKDAARLLDAAIRHLGAEEAP